TTLSADTTALCCLFMDGAECRRTVLPGAPINISRDDAGLKQVVLNATYYYNNRSNDAFLFKPAGILSAQRQVVKGIKYLVDFEISRTVCHKRNNRKNLTTCDFQPEGHLHQTLRCHHEVWLIPWENIAKTKVLFCRS
uniref:Cystatin domain-containing protein n=1 Tax=Mola mola TaxID=94237 RepID=A0A3Q3WDR2_MOLML